MKKLLSILAIFSLAITSVLLSLTISNNSNFINTILKVETKKENKTDSKKLDSLIKQKNLGSFNKKPSTSEIIKKINQINKLENQNQIKESDVDINIKKDKIIITLKSDKNDTVTLKYKNTHKLAEIIGGVLAGVVVLSGAGFLSYKVIKKQKTSKSTN
ncbi:hypothetical protein [Mycoplasma mycoides]|uniref:hypothetical protein n=1 Tax=Mycoplasma mycoides TaxID=2102 RepID=UPI00223FF433|nr:hypothetical protein [Mycoplasma mycoides]QVK04983.1 hypothetical protein I7640_02985 [Mycoplasma mycoides subsp. capri]